jgi:FkbM family methyltransferase
MGMGERPLSLKKLVRSVQVFFPVLQDARWAAQRSYHRLRRRPVDASYAALRWLSLRPDALLLDVGANRGQSIEAMRMFRPGARIISFEPNPVLAQRLADTYTREKNIEVRNLALGAEPGRFDLHLPVYRRWTFDGLASLDAREAHDWLSPDNLYFFDAKQLRLKTTPCWVEQLDALGLAPSFIKLDVQGLEYEVLQGGVATLREHRPALMLESPNPEKEGRLLADMGYKPYRFGDDGFVPGLGADTNGFYLMDEHLVAH